MSPYIWLLKIALLSSALTLLSTLSFRATGESPSASAGTALAQVAPAPVVDRSVRPVRLSIAYSCDASQFAGLFSSVSSVLSTVSDVSAIHVYIVVTAADAAAAAQGVADCLDDSPFVSVVPFDPSLIQAKSKVSADRMEAAGDLNVDQNFVRFYLSELLPETVNTILYIDADTIVRDDVLSIAGTLDDVPDGIVAAVVPRAASPYSQFLTDRILRELKIPRDAPSFNAGVLLLRLDRWREHQITATSEKLMRRQVSEAIYALGSQPPLLLALYGHTVPLDTLWNVDGLGYRTDIDRLDEAKLLHWNGKRKPWLPNGLWKTYYEPFACAAFA